MTRPGFERAVPPAARTSTGSVRANRDAVALLLAAFGYPTIPPEPPQSGSRRVHKAITETDDDDEEA